MSEAARQNAFWSYKPGHKLTPEESDAFDYGWRAAMRFMAQPRIPAPSIAPAKITEHSAHQPPRVSVPVAFGLLDWAESILCNAKPMDHCSREEWDGIVKSWRDQKHGIEQPRIPLTLTPTPVHKEPDQVAERFGGWKAPKIHWSKEEMEILRLAAEAGNQKPKEHNPHGLVECPECGGEGCIDSGGFDQQGHPINIGCPLCHGKPVTEAQVRAAGWVNANEKPAPKEHNPRGLVAFYTDAPNV